MNDKVWPRPSFMQPSTSQRPKRERSDEALAQAAARRQLKRAKRKFNAHMQREGQVAARRRIEGGG